MIKKLFKYVFAIAASLSMCACDFYESVIAEVVFGFTGLTAIPHKDYPFLSYPIVENGSSKEFTFVVVSSKSVTSEADNPNSERVNAQIVSSISVVGPEQSDVLLWETAFESLEDVAIEQFVNAERAQNVRFVAIEGDVADEMFDASWWQRFDQSLEKERIILKESVWNELFEGRVIFEITPDMFVADKWTKEILPDPIPGDYLELTNSAEFGTYNFDEDKYTFIYWTFTLTDEHLAEYAATHNQLAE